MRNSSAAVINRRLFGLAAVCFAALWGSVPSRAIAQTTTLYFSGTCTDCVGTGNLSLTLPSTTSDGVTTYSNSPVTITYASNILGNLTSDPGGNYAQVWAGAIDGPQPPTTPTAEFMELQWYSDNVSYVFVSCGNDTVVAQSGGNLCGTGGMAFGSWEVGIGAFMYNSGLPAGGSHIVTKDVGTDGLWTTTAPLVVAAPEIDAGSAAGAIVLLLGSLAVMSGRRTRPMRDLLAA